MVKCIDIKGQIFGLLTVVSYIGNGKWKCNCACGKEGVIKKTGALRSGRNRSCGCLGRIEDLVGRKIGHLQVLEKVLCKEERGKNRVKWKCVCDCGSVGTFLTESIKYRTQKGDCDCLSSVGHQREKTREISPSQFSSIRRNALARKIEFPVTSKQLLDLFEFQEEACYLTGVKLKLGYGKNWWKLGTASLDRVNPNIGYNIENIRWCCKEINTMKGDLKLEDFLAWSYRIHNPFCEEIENKACVPILRERLRTGVLEKIGNLSGSYWAVVVRNAKRRNIKLEITREQAWQKFLDQNGRCAITGINLCLNPFSKGRFGTASFDRINSDKCYSIDNVQWVHQAINNCFKVNLDEDEVKEWTKKIIDYNMDKITEEMLKLHEDRVRFFSGRFERKIDESPFFAEEVCSNTSGPWADGCEIKS